MRKGFTTRRTASCGVVNVALVGGLTLSANPPPTSNFASARGAAAPGSVRIDFRRINESDGRDAIASLVGPAIVVARRFGPQTRVDGLNVTDDHRPVSRPSFVKAKQARDAPVDSRSQVSLQANMLG